MSSSGARVIGTFNYKDGMLVSVDKNRRDFNDGLPVLVPADQIHKYYPLKSDPDIYVGSGLTRIHLRAGEKLPFSDKERILIKVSKDYVLFVEITDTKSLPVIYIQHPTGYHRDVIFLAIEMTAERTAAAKVLAEWEVQFLVGVIAGSSWTGLGSVIAGDVIVEAITSQKSPVTKQGVRAIYVVYTSYYKLLPVAPITTITIQTVIGITLIKGYAKHLDPGAMSTDPKVAGRAAGTIIAQMGKKGFQQRLTASALIWSILAQVGIKSGMEVPDTISKTLDEFNPKESEKAVENIEKVLKTVNVTLTDIHKKAMVKEITKNPGKISRIFSDMLEELKKPPR